MAEPDPLSAVEQSVGIDSSVPAAYMSALARVPGFAINDLDDAIKPPKMSNRVLALSGWPQDLRRGNEKARRNSPFSLPRLSPRGVQ